MKSASNKRRRYAIFVEAIQHYAPENPPQCYCCGEDNIRLLCLDHIHGGGNKHRKEAGWSHLSVWAKQNGWPDIFRVACHSCNIGAYLNNGVCPHLFEAALENLRAGVELPHEPQTHRPLRDRQARDP